MKKRTLVLGTLLLALLLSVGLVAAKELGLKQTSDIELSAGYQQAAFPGEEITFEHTIRYLGSGSTNVTLSVVADDQSWVVGFSPTSAPLDAGETVTFELTVRPPNGTAEATMHQITVTATGGGPPDQFDVVNTLQVLLRGGRVYLPIIARGATSPTAQLREIENLNGDGEYVVRWLSTSGATGYILEEATNPSFTGATTVYSGPDLATVIEGKPTGYYYYRVRTYESIGWSPIESTVVIPSPGIFGVVTYNQSPVSSIPLELQCYNGSSWYTADTTTTGSYGIYIFDGAPTLDGSRYCYVSYGPNTTDSRYLYLWTNYYIYYYVAGTTAPGGDFDIANVALGSPDTSTPQEFPLTFYWTRRSASPDDSYELRILSSSGEVWASGPLGYVGSYRMDARPSGLSSGVQYGWDLLVYGDDGIGISYETHDVVFDGETYAYLYIQNNTGGNMTFRIHGMVSKTIPPGFHLYDRFPPGTYTYTASAWCGSLTDSDYFPSGPSSLTFYCGANRSNLLVESVSRLDSSPQPIPRLRDSEMHRRQRAGGEP